jgi:hypothetical protein
MATPAARPAAITAGRWAAALLLAGLAGAVALRRGMDGWPGATSVPAAAVFTVLLLGLSLLGGVLLREPDADADRAAAGGAPGNEPVVGRRSADRPPDHGRAAGPRAAGGLLSRGRPGADRPRVSGHPQLATVLAGLAGAAVLAAAPFLQHLADPGPVLPAERLPVWAAAVVGVAVAEEVLLRGVLWRAVLRATAHPGSAPWVALAVTTVAFAVLHVPFYGAGSLPVDLAAGLLLGALRQWTGSVTAPVVAHLAADLAGWWLQ